MECTKNLLTHYIPYVSADFKTLNIILFYLFYSDLLSESVSS